MRFSFWLVLILVIDFQPLFSQENSTSWKDIQKSRKGTVTILWFPNDPFGYKAGNGQLKGIEVEIVKGFQKYLKEHYEIDLSIQWVEENTFKQVLTQIKNASANGIWGVAGFSFSEERKTFMKFSPSYMADMAVLVSTQDIPIVRSREDLKKYFEGATAITAQGTILEKELIQLRDQNQIHFNIEYTGGSDALIKVLRNRKKSFGYLNLPVYLMDLDKGLTKLNRQSYLTKRYEGRGIGLPKTSDWDVPLNEYFGSQEFRQNIEVIIAGYINIELYHFIETLNPENEVSLLNKEKDLQQMQLKLQQLVIKDKNEKQLYLIVISIGATILLIIIAILFRRQRKSHHQLKEQKVEIEAQSDEIKSINDNLELLIRERTRELETKNKALEQYAFITAHKLRGPLSTILGLVVLMEKIKLPEDDKILLAHLSKSTKKLDEIIHTVMNAIDNNDSNDQDKSV